MRHEALPQQDADSSPSRGFDVALAIGDRLFGVALLAL
jgi:hypothetical protein